MQVKGDGFSFYSSIENRGIEEYRRKTGALTSCRHPSCQRKDVLKVDWPQIDINTVINLISSTTTKVGLKVRCKVDNYEYQRGIQISDEAFENIDVEAFGRFDQWNYVVRGFRR